MEPAAAGSKNEGLDGRKPTNSLRIPLKIALKMALKGFVKADQGKNVWVLFFLFFLKEKEEAPGW